MIFTTYEHFVLFRLLFVYLSLLPVGPRGMVQQQVPKPRRAKFAKLALKNRRPIKTYFLFRKIAFSYFLGECLNIRTRRWAIRKLTKIAIGWYCYSYQSPPLLTGGRGASAPLICGKMSILRHFAPSASTSKFDGTG
jgi:hypothetical protein